MSSWLFLSHKKTSVSPLGILLQTEKTDLSPLHIFQLVKSLPFYLPEVWKWNPPWAEPLYMYWEYHPQD